MKLINFSINQDVLKIVALVTMTIDHIAKYIFDVSASNVFLGVGRMSFPIFAFLLMRHLANKQIYSKYLIRLGGFGGLVVGISWLFRDVVKIAILFPLNILISFFVVVLFLYVSRLIQREDGTKLMKVLMQGLNFLCFGVLSLVCDYGLYGFCFLILLYYYFMNCNKIILFLVFVFSWLINNGQEFWYIGVLTTFILVFNDYEKNNKRLLKKWWWFYVYYPLHLLIIGLVSYWVN